MGYKDNNDGRKILTKTFMETTAEKIDKITNEFRISHECIATDAYAITVSGAIVFVQTIYYKQ